MSNEELKALDSIDGKLEYLGQKLEEIHASQISPKKIDEMLSRVLSRLERIEEAILNQS